MLFLSSLLFRLANYKALTFEVVGLKTMQQKGVDTENILFIDRQC